MHRLSLSTVLLAVILGLGGPAQAADRQAAARFYEDAATRFELHDHAAAVVQLKNALQQDPEHRPSHVLMGRTYLELGEPGAAEEHLLKARTLGTDEALIVLPLAEAYLAQRKYSEVILNLRYSGYAPEVEYRLRTYQGRAHTELGELERAILAYRDAQRLDPMAPEPLAGEAMVLLLQGSVELARTKTRLAIERAPDSPEAWHAAAAVHHAMQEVDTAIEQYGRVLELRPAHMEARLARASLYLELDRDEEAASDLEQLRASHPYEVRATYLQSVLLDKQGDTRTARELLSETAQLLNTVPEEVLARDTSLQLLGGLANFSLEAYEQSEAFLKRFLAARPDDLGARRMLGAVYLSRRSYQGAIAVLRPLLEKTPNDTRVLHMIATAHMRSKRFEDALPLLERAAATSGGAIAIRTDLAMCRLALGEGAAAVEVLRAIMRDDPAQMRAGLQLGQLLLQRGELSEVVELAEALVAHQPGSTVALNLLATARFHAGAREAAAALFEQVVAQDPEFIPARINLAKLDLIEGRPAQARARYLSILEQQPEHVGTLLELGRLADQQGQLAEATEWVEKALAVRPRNVVAVEHLVNLLLRQGFTDRALQTARAAESWGGQEPRILLALSRAYLASERPDVAQALLRRVATAASYDAATLFQTALLQRQSGALDDAAWSLHKAVEGDPALLPARVELVGVLIELQRLEQALDAAQAIRDQEPDSPAGFGALGEALAAAGRHDEALEQFRLAHERAPSDFTAVKHALALQGGDASAAGQWLSGWVAAHPDSHMARQLLAELELRNGRDVQAREHYARLLKSRPDDPRLLNNNAHVLDRLGDAAGALALAERAQALAPNDPDVNDTLGWLLVQAGDAQRGLAFLRNAHSRSGLDPAIRYHIAVALSQLGRPSEARSELDAALASTHPFREREAAEQLLSELAD